MRVPRGISLASFALGVLSWLVAVLLFLRAVLFPSGGFEDLGAIVGAMLLVGAAAVPFALSLLLARRDGMPRWRVAVAALGSLVGLIMGVVWFDLASGHRLLISLPLLASGLLGIWGAWRLRGRPA